MRSPSIAFATLACALSLGACSPYSTSDRTVGGAAIGGVTGAVVGNVTTPRACIARDRYGRRIRVACP